MDRAVNFNHSVMTQGARALTSILAGFLCIPKGYKQGEMLAMLDSLQVLSQL